MKSKITAVFLTVYSFFYAQCPKGRVWLKSQQEVNKFKKDYPNCTELKETLIVADTKDSRYPSSIIPSSSIVDLTPLGNIAKIGGDVYIGSHLLKSRGKETGLKNLKGLNRLKFIGGSLVISYNNNLTSLVGLDSLKSVNGKLEISKNLRLKDASSIKNIKGVKAIRIYDNSYLEKLPVFHNIKVTENNFKATILIEDTKVKDLSTFKNLKKVYGDLVLRSNDEIKNLSGLDSLVYVGGNLNISRCNKLNSIKEIKNLISIGESLLLYNNRRLGLLDGLENIKKIDKDLLIENQQRLTGLDNFKSLKTIGRDLKVGRNSLLKFIKFPVLDSVKNVSVYLNRRLASTPFLKNVTKVNSYVISAGDSIKSIDFHNIVSIKNIVIANNKELKNITAFNSLNVGSIHSIEIKNNPALNICASIPICYFIENNKKLILNKNAKGCNTSNEIKATCITNYNQIKGSISYSTDSNCNKNSYLLKNITVQTTNDNSKFITVSKKGKFNFFVSKGAYSTKLTSLNSDYFTVTPDIVSTTFSSLKESVNNINFCIKANKRRDDLSISIIPLSMPLTGFVSSYKIVANNIGNTKKEGVIRLSFNSNKLQFKKSSINISQPNSDVLSWSFSNFKPFEKREFIVIFRVLPPPVNNINDKLRLKVNISSNDKIESDPKNNEFTLKQVIQGSYDPNDKTVLEGSKINIKEVDNYLNYIIRFQNTGNAAAKFVILKDKLSKKLDLTTFKKVSASHNETISIKNNLLTVRFNDINLPGKKTDEKKSNGFIAFKIKPKKNIRVGEIIYGKAQIFFDYNPPITTNTVKTEIVETPLSLNEATYHKNRLIIAPNPVEDFINIQGVSKLSVIKVTDYLGKQIKKIDVKNQKIDVRNLPQGIYILTILDNNKIITKKFLKK